MTSRSPLAGEIRTILADPPWRFINRTGKVAPEHRGLSRYGTLTVDEILRAAGRRASPTTAAPLPLGPERAAARWPRGHRRLGLQLQVQHRLAQGPQGRRLRRPRRRLLLPQRHRDHAVRRPRQERPHARPRPPPGEHRRHPQARALAQARRAIRRSSKPAARGPYLELFGRGTRAGWTVWGNQAERRLPPTGTPTPTTARSDRRRVVSRYPHHLWALRYRQINIGKDYVMGVSPMLVVFYDLRLDANS